MIPPTLQSQVLQILQLTYFDKSIVPGCAVCGIAAGGACVAGITGAKGRVLELLNQVRRARRLRVVPQLLDQVNVQRRLLVVQGHQLLELVPAEQLTLPKDHPLRAVAFYFQ